MIEMVVNLLKHKNPYTGLTYAEDPALSYIELQNEDDIFFYTSEKAFNACPTYQQAVHPAASADWLKAKYGSEEKLKQAWGDALQGRRKRWPRSNIVPQTNPWFFGDDHLPGQKGGAAPAAARQCRVSARCAEQILRAVRQGHPRRRLQAARCAARRGRRRRCCRTTTTCAPTTWSGYIDRHNYFGGGLVRLDARPARQRLFLQRPAAGGRPAVRPVASGFTVYPSLYSAEGPAIIAAYGLGLQGWDASYEFQSQSAQRLFSDRAGWPPWGVWEADVPTQLGQFPPWPA